MSTSEDSCSSCSSCSSEEMPLSTPEALDHRLISKATDQIGTDWRRVGRVLGFKESLLNVIDKDIDQKGNGVIEKCYRMLIKWQEREGDDADLDALCGALKKAKLKKIADDLVSFSKDYNVSEQREERLDRMEEGIKKNAQTLDTYKKEQKKEQQRLRRMVQEALDKPYCCCSSLPSTSGFIKDEKKHLKAKKQTKKIKKKPYTL